VNNALLIYLPEPLSPTVCGLFRALSVSVRLAVRVPAAEGVNVMLIKQLAPGASAAVQVVEAMAKLVAFGPVMLKEKLMSAPAPVLVTASVLGLAVVPILAFPKLMLGGLRLTMGAFTVCKTPDDVLVRKLPSPGYRAVSVLVPALRKIIEQFPAAALPVQLSPVLAVTVTVPVAVPVNCGATVKATTTGCWRVEGLGK